MGFGSDWVGVGGGGCRCYLILVLFVAKSLLQIPLFYNGLDSRDIFGRLLLRLSLRIAKLVLQRVELNC